MLNYSQIFPRQRTFWFVVLINLMFIAYFHNRFWWPIDDGCRIHQAQRILEGEVMNRDFQHNQPGYIGFLNAFALRIFGLDAVSLRIPLMAAAFVQSVLVFAIFNRRFGQGGMLASLVPWALGILQYLNPNQAWYCVFLALLLVFIFLVLEKRPSLRNFWAGFLLMTIYLFRQLNGVLVAIGILCYLLIERREKIPSSQMLLGRILLLLSGIALAGFLWRATDKAGFLLAGIWPLLLLLGAGRRISVPADALFKEIRELLGGAIVAFLPMAFYLSSQGTWRVWFWETFLKSGHIIGNQSSYEYYLGHALLQLAHPANLSEVLNGLFWVLVTLVGVINAGWLLLKLREKSTDPSPIFLLPILAVFNGLVALHSQSSVYLFYCVGMSVLGIMILGLLEPSGKVFRAMSVAISGLCAIALYYHAGQPMRRDAIRGQRVESVFAKSLFPNLSLWVDPLEIEIYRPVVQRIQELTGPDDPIIALPYNNEVYFLSNRRNATGVIYLQDDLQDWTDVKQMLRVLKERPPKLIVDMYEHVTRHNAKTDELLAYVKENYKSVERVGLFDIYSNVR